MQRGLCEPRFNHAGIGQTKAINLIKGYFGFIRVIKWPHPHSIDRPVTTHKFCDLNRTNISQLLPYAFGIVGVCKSSDLHKIV